MAASTRSGPASSLRGRRRRREITNKIASCFFSAALALSTPLAGVASAAEFSVSEADEAPIAAPAQQEEVQAPAAEPAAPQAVEEQAPAPDYAAYEQPVQEAGGFTVTEEEQAYTYYTDPSPQPVEAQEDPWAEVKGKAEVAEEPVAQAAMPTASLTKDDAGRIHASATGVLAGDVLRLALTGVIDGEMWSDDLMAAFPSASVYYTVAPTAEQAGTIAADIPLSDDCDMDVPGVLAGVVLDAQVVRGQEAAPVSIDFVGVQAMRTMAAGGPRRVAAGGSLNGTYHEDRVFEQIGTIYNVDTGEWVSCADSRKGAPGGTDSGGVYYGYCTYSEVDHSQVTTREGVNLGSVRKQLDYIAAHWTQDNGGGAAIAQWAIWHFTGPYAGNGTGNPNNSFRSADIWAMVNAADAYAASDSNEWEGCSVVLTITGTDQYGYYDYIMTYAQPLVGFRQPAPKKGNIEITKTSAKPELTDGNPLYSLEGAVYEVRKDGQTAATLTTDANGWARAEDLTAGDYTVVEVAAPQGFALDPAERTVTVPAGDTAYVTHADYPQMDPLVGIAQKVDSATGKAVAAGDGELAGAEFTVKYYAGQYSASNLPSSPTRTWVIRTDSDGFAALDPSYKVSGDEFFTSDSGIVQVPLGTVTIQETKAPKGYNINSELFVVEIPPDGSMIDTVEVDMTRTVPEAALMGGLAVQKASNRTGTTAEGDASLAGVVIDVYNASAASVWVGGKEYEPGAKVTSLTTDAKGYAATAADALPYGTYRVVEASVPAGSGLVLDAAEQTVAVHQAGVLTTPGKDMTDTVVEATVKVQKALVDSGRKVQGDVPSLAGVTFDVVNRSKAPVYVDGAWYAVGDVVQTLTTGADGSATSASLPYGTYELVETSAPASDGIRKTAPGQSFSVRGADDVVAADFTDEVVRGGISLQKASSHTGRDLEGDTSLEGIVFEVVNASAASVWVGGKEYAVGDVVATMSTDAEGKASTAADLLPYGTYTVREADVPHGTGMLRTAPEQTVQIREDGAVVPCGEDFVDEPMVGGLTVTKYDLETLDPERLGGATLAGIEFQVTNASANPVLVGGTLYGVGEVVATLTTDEDGFCETGQVLPYGTYEVRETKVNATYLPGDGHAATVQVREDGAVYDVDKEGHAADFFANQVKRGDVSFNKVDEDSMGRMGGIPFKVTSLTTGEWHVVVSDRNGQVDTATGWNAHSASTNANDAALAEDGAVDASALDPEAGVWFYGFTGDGRTEAVDDSLGALPYDTYSVEELRVPANEGTRLVSFDVAVYKHGSDTHLGTVDDKAAPDLGTELMAPAEDDPHSAVALADVTLVDHVVYTNVPKGTYTLNMTLMDKETGEAVTDAEGSPVTGTATVKALAPNGEAQVEVSVDLSRLAGHDVVAFEVLLDADGNEVASHRDLDDGDQTVAVTPAPEIGTTLEDAQGGHATPADSAETVLVDTVAYRNLKPGKAYAVTGTLMDKETGEAFLDASGEPVTGRTEFTPEEAEGTVEVEFEFDLSGIAGKTLVAFETLVRDGREMAVHAEIDDEAQTVTVPVIGTTLADAETGWREAPASATLTLVDTVAYKGLEPGRAYTANGTLVDKGTGEAVTDAEGAEVTASAEFTPEEAEGTVEVGFSFDASLLAGRTLVAFESVESDGRTYAVHADIEDEGQTVDVPGIRTTLVEKEAGAHDSAAAESVTLVDTVTYTGLTPGQAYTVTGTLMDKLTGEAIADAEGNPVTATAEFTPEEADGAVELEFAFDATSLSGGGAVAFETVERDGSELAVHADLSDEDQTVRFPEIGTTLVNGANGTHMAAPKGAVTLVDTIAYRGLTPGKAYTATGTLMDKATGEAFADAEGNPVTATAEFTPEAAEGTVEVAFEFQAGDVAGTSVVAFESVSTDGREVAVHADLEDEGQTVSFVEIGTTLKDDVTRTHTGTAVEAASLTDTVAYRGLVPGREYELVGYLMDKATGTRLSDADGKEIEARATFAPEAADGEAAVTFAFDASALAGRTVVAEEHVYTDGAEVAVHADVEDEGQTVTFCSIGTTLTSPEGGHAYMGGGLVDLTDAVAYTGLVYDGYTLDGSLVFKDSGEPVAYADGTPVAASVRFAPETPDGTVEVVFRNLDAGLLDGREVVAFETLTVNVGAGDAPHEIAWHRDLSDSGQTVSFGVPVIGTTLVDAETGGHESPAKADLVLVDTVSYDGLTPGEEYELTGTLMDKATGEAVQAGGQPVTATSKFTPEATTGTATVTFSFDASKLGGTTVVAFESLLRDGREVAVHADIEDRDQAVSVVGIRTTATNAADGSHEAPAAAGVALVDRVELTGVEPGATYTIQTELADAASRETIAKSSVDVAPSKADTAYNVAATIDLADYAGRDVVFLETLVRDGRTVAEHRDYTDVGQTVRVAPGIGTTLVEKASGAHDATVANPVTLVDTVSYKGLEAGASYTLSGTLMYGDGKAVANADGTPVTSTVTFRPTASDGTQQVEFTFDATRLTEGSKAVAFETLADANGRTVAEHKDMNDAGQTVTFHVPTTPSTPAGTTTATNMPQTGQGMLWAALIALGALLAAGGLHYARTGRVPLLDAVRDAAARRRDDAEPREAV